MKKTLLTLAAAAVISASAMAQTNVPAIDFQNPNVYALKSLPKATRDSLITTLRKSAQEMNNPSSYKFNDQVASGKMRAVLKDWYKGMSALLIEVLENPTEANVARNQRKLNRLQSQFQFDMQLLAEESNYNTSRKEIIDEYKNGDYDDAEERRDARKEMKDDLRDLEEDYRDTIKDLKEEHREALEAQAEQEADAMASA
jgi:hypothetical protein